MRARLIVRTAVVLVLSALVVVPARAHTDNSPVDRADGTGVVVADAIAPARVGDALSFIARGRDGEVTGSVTYRPTLALDPFAAWDGTVDCLYVDGKLAFLSGDMRYPGTSTDVGRFTMMIRNTIDLDFGEDPVVLRYGADVAGTCSSADFVGVPVVLASVSGRVHDGAKDTIQETLPL
jgi:hypothetical protein